jgi:positive regulator of sigma E activity
MKGACDENQIIYLTHTYEVSSQQSTFFSLPDNPLARFWLSQDPALMSAVLVGFAGLFGVLVGVYLVQKFPRKLLMIVSAAGTAFSFWALGGYYLALGDNGKVK